MVKKILKKVIYLKSGSDNIISICRDKISSSGDTIVNSEIQYRVEYKGDPNNFLKTIIREEKLNDLLK